MRVFVCVCGCAHPNADTWNKRWDDDDDFDDDDCDDDDKSSHICLYWYAWLIPLDRSMFLPHNVCIYDENFSNRYFTRI